MYIFGTEWFTLTQHRQRTGVAALLSVRNFAVELAGRHLQTGVHLVNGHSEMFFYVGQVLPHKPQSKRLIAHRCTEKSVRQAEPWIWLSVHWHGWVAGRASGLKKNWVVGCRHSYVSGSRCRFAYVRPSWCHWHSLSLAQLNPDWFYFAGFTFLVCVCVCMYLLLDTKHHTVQATYQWFVVPDAAATLVSQTRVVAAFAAVWTVGVIPHLHMAWQKLYISLQRKLGDCGKRLAGTWIVQGGCHGSY